MTDFLNMGGYAEYIWPCYGMAALLLVALLVFSLKDLAKNKKDLLILEQIADEEK